MDRVNQHGTRDGASQRKDIGFTAHERNEELLHWLYGAQGTVSIMKMDRGCILFLTEGKGRKCIKQVWESLTALN